MTEKDILRKAMIIRDWSQAKLARTVGYERTNNLTNLLHNNKSGTRIDTLVKLFDAMGYDIVIRDRYGSQQEFLIDMKPEIEKSPMPGDESKQKKSSKSSGS